MPFIARKGSSGAGDREMRGSLQDRGMTTRQRRVERAVILAGDISDAARRAFRLARISAGLSRSDVARAADVSPSQVDRFERGALRDVRVEQVCRLSLAVGLVPGMRFFPDADPLRDAGQVKVLGRLLARLPASAGIRTEVPLYGRSDARAWDAVGMGFECRDAFEVETRLWDLQATERRVMLKLRDDQTIHHVFLVVADTKANRRALAAGREALRGNFPLDTRAAMASLCAGRCPGANGVLIV
jgi:transcriptional regulator with XRE-family HTH domain